MATPTTPVIESSADQAVAAKKAPPAKNYNNNSHNKALAENSSVGTKSAAKKAAPAKKVTAKKVTAKKAAPPKISPAETAAPTTSPQPPADVDVDASGRCAAPAEKLEQ